MADVAPSNEHFEKFKYYTLWKFCYTHASPSFFVVDSRSIGIRMDYRTIFLLFVLLDKFNELKTFKMSIKKMINNFMQIKTKSFILN